MERTLQPSGLVAGLRAGKDRRHGQYDPSFFARRTASLVAVALVAVALGALSGTYVGFDFVQAILDVPSGFAQRSSVDLPAPDEPMMDTNSPRATAIDTPSSAFDQPS